MNESPYCYVGNNPTSRIDPDGRLWGDKEARREARAAKKDMRNAIKETKLFMGHGAISKTDGKERIQDLKAGIKEIREMGKNKECTFYAKPQPNLKDGYTERTGNIITMGYNNTVSGARGHEFKHGYQSMTKTAMNNQAEVPAYQRYLAVEPQLTALHNGYGFTNINGQTQSITTMSGFTLDVINSMADEDGMLIYGIKPINPISPKPLENKIDTTLH